MFLFKSGIIKNIQERNSTIFFYFGEKIAEPLSVKIIGLTWNIHDKSIPLKLFSRKFTYGFHDNFAIILLRRTC